MATYFISPYMSIYSAIIITKIFVYVHNTGERIFQQNCFNIRVGDIAVIFDFLDMEEYIRTAKNLNLTKKIKAGVVEAFFGVVYNEKGSEECFDLWNRLHDILSGLDDFNYKNVYVEYQDLKNAKSTLQEYCLNFSFELPDYNLIEKTGPDHAPEFKVKLILRHGANKLGFEEVFETINKRIDPVLGCLTFLYPGESSHTICPGTDIQIIFFRKLAENLGYLVIPA